MIEIRPFAKLGHANHGWLNATHHFSFADYFDRNRMNWGRLRVWNDDQIAAQAGFPSHPHSNMEIITYVRKGAIFHRDSLGNEGKTDAGDVQVMSAGTGIVHSEYNPDNEEGLIFQIWITPDRNGHKPSWGNRPFPKNDRQGRFVPLASGFEEDHPEALNINTSGRVSGATLSKGQKIEHSLLNGCFAYLVPSTGKITINGVSANARDGIAIKDETSLIITAEEDAELVLVETLD
ncbi:pirin family protein [Aristophania vespae]|uniref:pirin family protein n=1 Tax=Aristophania vespae TaxID=2697033 RepID=UPI0023518D5D|nr:pirin family protein [Aristophania vespae]UMM63932.1 Quercetin 2,3-dioxygenase [Aristophania vespae]